MKSRDLRLLSPMRSSMCASTFSSLAIAVVHDQPLARIQHIVERLGVAGQLRVHAPHAARLRGIDEDAVQIVEIVVAGRAVHRPAGWQLLGAGEDFLGDDVQRTGRPAPASAVTIPATRAARSCSITKYRAGIEQPVRVIDPDRVHLPVANQLAEQLVGRVEDVCVLDAQAGQRVDVEEPPVVDFVRRRTPVRQAGTAAPRAVRAARRSSRHRRACR